MNTDERKHAPSTQQSHGAASRAWHALSADETLAALASSAAGLDDAEVARRMAVAGRNEIADAKPIRPLALLAAQFKSVLIAILLAAAVVSGVSGEWTDCFAIGAILVINAGIGFVQEYGAEKALAALRKLTGRTARVRRAGAARVVKATELVAGDVILLESGDVVPADARLLEAAVLRTNEAPLTGESLPVAKDARTLDRADAPLADRSNMVHLGTSVATGCAVAVVTAIGMATEVGRIARLVAHAGDDEVTPLQRRLAALGRMLAWCALTTVGLVFATGLARGLPLLEVLLTSVSLAVAAVPEGLPAVVTIALAVGVQRMARRRALVRKLQAVETLGAATVVCTDKTGTLTVGEMTVRALAAAGRRYVVTGEGYAPEGDIRLDNGNRPADPLGQVLAASEVPIIQPLLAAFAGCATASLVLQDGAWIVVGDPTEGALLAAAAKVAIAPETIERDAPKLAEIPFDSERKRMSVLRRGSGETVRLVVKGAPDVVLGRCSSIRDKDGVRSLTAEDRAWIHGELSAFADRALRVLAAAERDMDRPPPRLDPEVVERDLTWLGIAGMVDPPRPEAKAAVAKCKEAGIRVVMITGDHPRTAIAVARELGIAGPDGGQQLALSGPDVDAMDDAAFARAARDAAVYARVTAAHKLRIVRALQAAGEVVAMTGDGVNDAPAIRGADVGIAMGKSGTEVTKEASDIVITDDHFATIVEAIEQGRGVDQNVRKTLLYLLAGNLGELIFVVTCVAFLLPLPLAPIQLLWINLITDGFPALCLAVDPIDEGVMRRKPRSPRAPIIDRDFVFSIAGSGFVTAAAALGVYLYALRSGDVEMARAHAFTTLIYVELLRSFSFRSESRPLWTISVASNLKLLGVVVLGLALQFAVPHFRPLGELLRVPAMSMSHCLALLGVAVVATLAIEGIKLARRTR
ncbi:MAG: cation-translocating P-type ATPase [Planctomycetes bacterium]|nr:cation-translocating P-type ATPase [Planctomycetota bacterium]MCC7171211.1 cation-translocating P-type ATPase [Planctomycetota bacterium]